MGKHYKNIRVLLNKPSPIFNFGLPPNFQPNKENKPKVPATEVSAICERDFDNNVGCRVTTGKCS